jgi:hypothetical protein
MLLHHEVILLGLLDLVSLITCNICFSSAVFVKFFFFLWKIALGEPGKQQFYHFTAGGPTAYKKALLKKFPKEEKAIDRYLVLLKVSLQVQFTVYLI